MILGEAILFGAVQGLTEFLPVSSSGHLLLLHSITHFSVGDDLSFDVALHIGTLLAVVVYFWKDLWRILKAWLHSFGHWNWSDENQRLAWLLIIASVPGAIIGALLEQAADSAFRQPVLVGITLIIGGVALWWADRTAKADRSLGALTWKQSLVIGLGQAAAVVPGISRSGASILVGRLFRLTREAAAKFSFLMSVPIIAGAAGKKLFELRHVVLTGDQKIAFFVGALTAAIVGALAIKVLLRYISRHSYGIFAAYRVALGLVVFIVVWLAR